MTTDERIAIETTREYLVVKSNTLIQKSRFELSLAEQKTIAFICALIKPIDAVDKAKGVPFQLEYDFNIRDYCKVCGISYDSGKNYEDIKATLKKLSDRSMWVEIGDEEVLCRWLAKVRTNKKSGIAHIKIDEDLVPYLFDLGQKFTQYQLYNILAFKSAFSVRMYELLKSYAFQKNKTFGIEELKVLLGVENVKSYKEFAPFRQKVLEVAEREINELSDLRISFEPITKGRKVVSVKFCIKQKDALDTLIAQARTREMTDQEKREYDELTAHAEQMSMF